MSDPKPAEPTEPTPTSTPTTTATPTPTSTDPVDPAVTPPVDPKPADPDDASLISKVDPAPKSDEPLTVEDLKLPEGIEINEDAQKEFIDILNKDLSRQELADKLLNLQTTMDQAASDSISQAWEDMVKEWETAAGAHPDFGGDKLAPALGSIKTLINEVMGDKAKDVFEVFDLTGMGSNPVMISLLHKLASERAEGTLASGAPNVPTLTHAEQMFPSQGKR